MTVKPLILWARITSLTHSSTFGTYSPRKSLNEFIFNQPPSPNLFTEYVHDAKETFSQLIEHRTDAHIFKEMDVSLDNTPQHVQLPKPRIDSMKTKMFMREGMKSFTDATVQ